MTSIERPWPPRLDILLVAGALSHRAHRRSAQSLSELNRTSRASSSREVGRGRQQSGDRERRDRPARQGRSGFRADCRERARRPERPDRHVRAGWKRCSTGCTRPSKGKRTHCIETIDNGGTCDYDQPEATGAARALPALVAALRGRGTLQRPAGDGAPAAQPGDRRLHRQLAGDLYARAGARKPARAGLQRARTGQVRPYRVRPRDRRLQADHATTDRHRGSIARRSRDSRRPTPRWASSTRRRD